MTWVSAYTGAAWNEEDTMHVFIKYSIKMEENAPKRLDADPTYLFSDRYPKLRIILTLI